MKLDWKDEGVIGNIKRLKRPVEMTIHKLIGCGEALFLSCYGLQIVQRDLNTEDWNIAEKRAVDTVEHTACNIYADAMQLAWWYRH